uniref:Lin-9 DREAM MuvB core complex component n=1 Tax=Varanus komodoensis TaxID=61221 RepID=A0A8D2LK54_VARKO
MPFRSSKRSRSFCEEEERQMSTRSPKRNQRVTMVPQKFTVTMPTPDKKASQKIGLRLRNLLKLPKAHKWCIYEWFYSNIDKPLFEGDNDFCVCLKESFPNLKTRKLTRVEWGKIRRLMGKPRRCSSAFFEEERSALKQKRQKIRLLQQRKVADISQFKDLPEEIPLPLVIGTKVTARLRGAHDGLFTGQIDAVDTLNATYRVTFERTGLGTHTIPDYEVLSNEPHETMPIAAFGQKQRPSRFFMTPPRLHYTPSLQSPITVSDMKQQYTFSPATHLVICSILKDLNQMKLAIQYILKFKGTILYKFRQDKRPLTPSMPQPGGCSMRGTVVFFSCLNTDRSIPFNLRLKLFKEYIVKCNIFFIYRKVILY